MKVNLFNKITSCKKLNLPEFETKGGIKVIKSALAKDSLRGDLVEISTMHPEVGSSPSVTFISELGAGYPFGTHSFFIDKSSKILNGSNMNVSHFHQHRGYGELMRLASIIHMKENGLVKNSIEALSQAIPFHYKYGFRPDYERVLENNSDSFQTGENSPFNLLFGSLWALTHNKGLSRTSKDKANFLIDTLMNKSGLEKKDLKVLDSIMVEYIEKHLDNWDYHLMIDDVPMSLSMSKVEENSSFYNELYEKHSIDYGV